VDIVGFIIRIYHDARFSECQMIADCLEFLQPPRPFGPVHDFNGIANNNNNNNNNNNYNVYLYNIHV
jgi:hypothetical protein